MLRKWWEKSQPEGLKSGRWLSAEKYQHLFATFQICTFGEWRPLEISSDDAPSFRSYLNFQVKYSTKCTWKLVKPTSFGQEFLYPCFQCSHGFVQMAKILQPICTRFRSPIPLKGTTWISWIMEANLVALELLEQGSQTQIRQEARKSLSLSEAVSTDCFARSSDLQRRKNFMWKPDYAKSMYRLCEISCIFNVGSIRPCFFPVP